MRIYIYIYMCVCVCVCVFFLVRKQPGPFISVIIIRASVVVAWSVESLPSNPAGSGILISVRGLSVCPLSVLCPVLSPAEALTLC